MDGRRKERREIMAEKAEQEYYRKKPKIADLFDDAKKQLAKVTEEEWASIPDIGDHSLRYKQKRTQDNFTPVPDNLIESRRLQSSITTSLDPRSLGIETPLNVSKARADILSQKLHSASDDVGGKTNVDPQGYMTELNSIKVSSESEIADLKKARLLLKSMTSSNPKHGPGWIAAARLEEQAGKITEARKIIKQGCEMCQDNEDVWIEACRLQPPNKAKGVLAKAVNFLPKSVKIWMKAADLESDINLKREVIRKALEFIPNSVTLWKAAVELETPDDAKILLESAVECVPQSVELWLALAKLEDYENAKNVLNRARASISTDPRIWIAAAQLEEANGQTDRVNKIIEKAIKSLTSQKVEINRKIWLEEAENVEKAGSKYTCIAIVNNVLDIGIEDLDKKRTFLGDAKSFIERKSYETARAIYSYTLKMFPNYEDIWIEAINLEKTIGTAEELNEIMKNALLNCNTSINLWLIVSRYNANELNNINGARTILKEAFEKNKNIEEFISNENIWLEAIQLEWNNKEYEKTRSLLKQAREKCNSQRLWMKSCLLEWELKNYNEELKLLKESIDRFPSFDKLYMMLGQYYEEQNNIKDAIDSYKKGRIHCMSSITLWVLCANLEEKIISVAKARATLESCRIKNPNNDLIWYESMLLEKRNNNNDEYKLLLARGLQECPNSGILWSEELSVTPRAQQRTKSADALAKCPKSAIVISTIAGIFERDGKYDKARNWYERALYFSPDDGDIWCKYIKFILKHGKGDEKSIVMDKCIKSKPHKGRLWCSISKQRDNRHLSVQDILTKILNIMK